MRTHLIQFLDEVEFTSFIYEIILAAGPAFAKAAMNAARNNAVRGRIFISTPGDLDDAATQQALKIVDETCPWTEKMYDMSSKELKDYLNANTGDNDNPIVYVEYQYYQLGEGRTWFNKMCGVLLNDPIAIRRELLLQRVNGSNNSPFRMEDLMAITDMKKRPLREEIILGKYKFDIYTEVPKSRVVFVCVDTSTATGGDNNAITVIDPYTKKPVAEFLCKYMSSVDLRKFVYHIVKKFYPNAVIIPERNAGGYTLIDELLETDIGHRIYFENTKDITNDIDDKMDRHGFLKSEAMQRKVRGVYTGTKTRPLMMRILTTHVEEYKDTFVTNNITSDLNNLVNSSSGKIEAARGKHDDAMMSYLIGLYVLYHGKNLHRFGFSRGMTEEELNKGGGGLIYDEKEAMQHLEEYVQDRSVYGEDFMEGFKTGSRSANDASDEYEQMMVAARKRANEQYDPYESVQVRNFGNDESEMYTKSGSIPGSFFTDINS